MIIMVIASFRKLDNTWLGEGEKYHEYNLGYLVNSWEADYRLRCKLRHEAHTISSSLVSTLELGDA